MCVSKKTSVRWLVGEKEGLFISSAAKIIIFMAFVDWLPPRGPPCWDFEELRLTPTQGRWGGGCSERFHLLSAPVSLSWGWVFHRVGSPVPLTAILQTAFYCQYVEDRRNQCFLRCCCWPGIVESLPRSFGLHGTSSCLEVKQHCGHRAF